MWWSANIGHCTYVTFCGSSAAIGQITNVTLILNPSCILHQNSSLCNDAEILSSKSTIWRSMTAMIYAECWIQILYKRSEQCQVGGWKVSFNLSVFSTFGFLRILENIFKMPTILKFYEFCVWSTVSIFFLGVPPFQMSPSFVDLFSCISWVVIQKWISPVDFAEKPTANKSNKFAKLGRCDSYCETMNEPPTCNERKKYILNKFTYDIDRSQSLFYFVPQDSHSDSHRQAGSSRIHPACPSICLFGKYVHLDTQIFGSQETIIE